jgi:hypothetical protein
VRRSADACASGCVTLAGACVVPQSLIMRTLAFTGSCVTQIVCNCAPTVWACMQSGEWGLAFGLQVAVLHACVGGHMHMCLSGVVRLQDYTCIH